MTSQTQTIEESAEYMRRALETIDCWLISPSFDPEVVGVMRELVTATLRKVKQEEEPA